MTKIILSTFAMCVMAAVFAIGVRAEGVKAGQWSMTMVTKMEGMSEEMNEAMKEMENMSAEEKAMMQKMMGNMNVQMGAGSQGITTTITQCVSNDHPVPTMENDEDCEETHTIDGNTVKFEMACKSSKSTGEVTYNNDAMEGQIQSQQIENGKEVNATIELSGQYLGPCPQ